MPAEDSPSPHDIDELGRMLRHHDRSQLLYQWNEIVRERAYLRHGVEVREGDVVLDVGANVGVAAVFFAAVCGARVVHSFEPVPAIFKLLRQNTERYPACVVHPFGLSSAEGEVPITYYPRATAMSGLYADPAADRDLVRAALVNLGSTAEEADRELEGRYEPVEAKCELRRLSTALDAESLEWVDLLKIDVERAELDVLEGIDEDDWPVIRQVAVEVHDTDDRLAWVTEMLAERGFTVAADQDEPLRGTPVHMVYARRP